MRKKIKYFLGFLLVCIFILLIGIYYFAFRAELGFEGDKIFKVSKGMNFSQIAESLKVNGVIKNIFLFKLAGRIMNVDREIKVGKYLFHGKMSNLDIIKCLKTGESAMKIDVTIPEGLTARIQAKIFARELGIDSAKFMQLVFDKNFIQEQGIEASSLEGYLMPDTYQFYWQTDEEEIIQRLLEQFRKVYNDTLQRRAEILGLNINQVLTIASIVEGETRLDSEKATIAGVYYNRLKKRMLLQADPTIQYVLEDGPRLLKYKDLTIESPYNTYKYIGLPPTPINNPGKAAILAALYPEKHNYLYFVASGNGGHTFSKTYSEHLKNVNNYRKLRNSIKGKND